MTEARFGRPVYVSNRKHINNEERLWKNTATPEQARVIADVEKLITQFTDEHYTYIFGEAHVTINGKPIDGWRLIVFNRETGERCGKIYPGFPGSTTEVLNAAFLQFKQLKEREDV